MYAEWIRTAIAAKLESVWSSSLGQVVYPNQDSVNVQSGQPVYRVQITYPPTGRQRESIGSPGFIRRRGYLFFHGEVPAGSGTKDMNNALEFFNTYFSEARLMLPNGRHIVFDVANVQTLGFKDGRYRESAIVKFYVDE